MPYGVWHQPEKQDIYNLEKEQAFPLLVNDIL